MSFQHRFDNPVPAPRLDHAPVVLRFAQLFPRDLKRREMHRKRKGGDLSHIRHHLTELNHRWVGEEGWIDDFLQTVERVARENLRNEIDAREGKRRWTEVKRVKQRGLVDPWKFTKNGPLREGMIARKAVDLARRKSLENLNFSVDGWRELTDFHDIVLRNVQQGIAVLMSEDVGLARALVEQKERVRNVARDLQSLPRERLRRGTAESIETSAIHLELLRAFKSLNTSFAMIGYPLLRKRGELLESRLTEV